MNLQSHVAARIGGDEFVVVLDGVVDAPAVAAIADRLLADLAQPYQLGSSPVQSTASIGVVVYRAEVADSHAATESGPGHLEALAETLLRDCRRGDVRGQARRPRALDAVRRFDARKGGARHRAGARTRPAPRAAGTTSCMSSTNRWWTLSTPAPGGCGSTGALAAPPSAATSRRCSFISLAEECGLIDAVGETVLRRGLRASSYAVAARSWGEHAPRLLAVNLSRAQLKQSGAGGRGAGRAAPRRPCGGAGCSSK
jgi:hypothetical protein